MINIQSSKVNFLFISLSFRKTFVVLLTFSKLHSGSVLSSFQSLSAAAFASGVFIACVIGINLCTKLWCAAGVNLFKQCGLHDFEAEKIALVSAVHKASLSSIHRWWAVERWPRPERRLKWPLRSAGSKSSGLQFLLRWARGVVVRRNFAKSLPSDWAELFGVGFLLIIRDPASCASVSERLHSSSSNCLEVGFFLLQEHRLCSGRSGTLPASLVSPSSLWECRVLETNVSSAQLLRRKRLRQSLPAVTSWLRTILHAAATRYLCCCGLAPSSAPCRFVTSYTHTAQLSSLSSAPQNMYPGKGCSFESMNPVNPIQESDRVRSPSTFQK